MRLFQRRQASAICQVQRQDAKCQTGIELNQRTLTIVLATSLSYRNGPAAHTKRHCASNIRGCMAPLRAHLSSSDTMQRTALLLGADFRGSRGEGARRALFTDSTRCI